MVLSEKWTGVPKHFLKMHASHNALMISFKIRFVLFKLILYIILEHTFPCDIHVYIFENDKALFC
jgi:hypothetical protein